MPQNCLSERASVRASPDFQELPRILGLARTLALPERQFSKRL
jgi:hypothetical protein